MKPDAVRKVMGPEMLYIPHGSDETSRAFSFSYASNVLYIPHGSDETSRDDNYCDSWLVLYIPHGSDETDIFYFRCKINRRLYIPHGSDETTCSMYLAPAFRDFISHMVQMKLPIKRWFWKQSFSLYPTWFRWNRRWEKMTEKAMIALYPTWFRWNDKDGNELKMYYSFISHMVQMKPILKQARSLTLLPLYPTWFRWNESGTLRLNAGI